MMSFMAAARAPSHRKLSKMNFNGHGPWIDVQAGPRSTNVAKPKELLEMAQAVGVTFLPCQMTMDMFGIQARGTLRRRHGRARRSGHGLPAHDRRRTVDTLFNLAARRGRIDLPPSATAG